VTCHSAFGACRVDLSGDREHGLEELVQRVAEQAPTDHPVAVSVKSHSRPPRLRKRSVVALGALLVTGMAALVFLGLASKDDEKSVNTSGGVQGIPAAAPSSASAQARPEVSAAEELLRRFETATDSRSRWLLVKSDWVAAARAFEATRDMLPAGSSERRDLDVKAAFARGRFELLEGRLLEAERSLRHAAAERSAWAPPHVELSTVYARLGRFDEAHVAAQAARAGAPGWWLAQAASGAVYSAEGKFADAISVYEAALSAHDVPHLRGSLALAYHAARLHDARSLTLAREALARDPDLPSALLVLAEHELEQKRAAKALEHSQRLVDFAVFDVSAWLIHGDALLALGRQDEAKRALERAVELFVQSKQLGAPPQRLKEVERALAAGTLPAARGVERSRPKAGGTRPGPSADRAGPKGGLDYGF
jgi:Flp pilus assembly protein TadD